MSKETLSTSETEKEVPKTRPALQEKYAEEKKYTKKTIAHFSKKKKEMNKEISRLDREDPYSSEEIFR